MTASTRNFILLSALVIVAAASRLFDHPSNFTPVGAIALFGGAYFTNRKLAFLVPACAMLLSDLIIGFHHTMAAVYISFLAIGIIGYSIRKNITTGRVITASLASSILFFVATNFAVWTGGTLYPKTFDGLLQCYAAAIPFYQNSLFGSFLFNTVMGDLFFNGLLFGVFHLVQAREVKQETVQR